jgi:hypothetical protein
MPEARIHVEPVMVPDGTYPMPPYHFIGEGITIVYEIPFSRVKNSIPAILEPDPGNGKIWFMVNFYDWRHFYPLSNPDDRYSFCEAYYKFSVTHQSKLGDYPVKLYLTSEAGIASGIELYGYPKYYAEMKFDMKDREGHFVISRNGRSELEIDLVKAGGITAKISTFFANAMARSYLKRYTGNFLFKKENGSEKMISGTTHIRSIRYDQAEINKIFLREPLEWNILTQAEILKPKYAFILTDVTADLDPPETILVESSV